MALKSTFQIVPVSYNYDMIPLSDVQDQLASGDNADGEVRRVAARIGADDCHWGLTPAEKTVLVKRLREKGFVLMVGDGGQRRRRHGSGGRGGFHRAGAGPNWL